MESRKLPEELSKNFEMKETNEKLPEGIMKVLVQ